MLVLVVVHRIEGEHGQEVAGLVDGSSCVDPLDPGLDQGGPHAAHAVADAALDGPLGCVEQLGHLDVGAPVEVGQLDGPALVGGRSARAPETLSARARSQASWDMSYSAAAVRWASLASRARRALSERMASTARAWDWASRNERKVPRPGSKRSGWFHRRKNTSWVTSSASDGAVEDAPGQAVDGPAVTAVHLGQRHLAVAGNGGDELRITDFADLFHLLLHS